MSNSFFRFKQFTIHQDRCAMKVGTDGVLLGAWTDTGNANRILDIGTGTGLIALMLAQRSAAFIDAIEIDEEAANQAAENVRNSPWPEKIKVHHASLQEYLSCKQRYNLIVTNPPYFVNALISPDPKRTLARHDHRLGFADLLKGVTHLLTPDGRFDIILPVEVFDTFNTLAAKAGLYAVRKTMIKPSPSKRVNRVLADYCYVEKETVQHEMIIEKYGRHSYSEEYIELIKMYYLNPNSAFERC